LFDFITGESLTASVSLDCIGVGYDDYTLTVHHDASSTIESQADEALRYGIK
jgi:hypothetical protein